MKTPTVKAWLADILSSDPMTFEDAYWGVRPSAVDVVPELVKLLDLHKDSYTRGKIIELLGESGDTSILAILEIELQNPDEGIMNWAKGAIEALKSRKEWQQQPKYI